MPMFQRDLDAAAERARRFFADARDPARRRGDLANAALELSETLISLAFRSERLPSVAENDADAEPTILRFDAFRSPSSAVETPPAPEPRPTLKLFVGDAESPRRAPTFPRLFVPCDERPRLRVVAD
ncbi:MAG: hypothetical protein IKU86_07725 [Thermoguttaceae bacterium]|nr:hypothetical protein [Thermoguttaceae bacterium]